MNKKQDTLVDPLYFEHAGSGGRGAFVHREKTVLPIGMNRAFPVGS